MSDVKFRELIEYRDLFQEYLNMEINREKALLGNLQYVGKEAEAYSRISTYQYLGTKLEKLQEEYTRMIVEKEKEEKKKAGQ